MKVIASFRRLPLLPKVGWALYIVSMVIPSSDLNGVGAEIFVFAPLWGVMFLLSGSVSGLLFGVSLLAEVAANATLFTRIPVWLRIAAMIIP